jgi:hypothetical protein
MIKDVIIHKIDGPGRGTMSQALTAIGKKRAGALPALFAPDAKNYGTVCCKLPLF